MIAGILTTYGDLPGFEALTQQELTTFNTVLHWKGSRTGLTLRLVSHIKQGVTGMEGSLLLINQQH